MIKEEGLMAIGSNDQNQRFGNGDLGMEFWIGIATI